MLINRETLPQHRPWIVSVVVFAAAALAGYLLYAAQGNGQRWPGGSSLPGLILGTIAAGIIFFEVLLWPRKWPKVRAWRIGRTQIWLRAHIWLGLLSVPLVVLHHGLSMEWGGLLTFALMICFWGVIVSGVVGLWLQHVVPSYMLQSLPAESIASQLTLLRHQMVEDAESLLSQLTGTQVAMADSAPGLEGQYESGGHRVVGALRTVGRVRGRVLETQLAGGARVDRKDAAALLAAFKETIRPFLLGGKPVVDLHKPTQATTYFIALRGSVSEEARDAVTQLEGLCEARRQHASQKWAHVVLHGWMAVHLPLSIALVVLLVLHIVTALRYAGVWPV